MKEFRSRVLTQTRRDIPLSKWDKASEPEVLESRLRDSESDRLDIQDTLSTLSTELSDLANGIPQGLLVTINSGSPSATATLQNRFTVEVNSSGYLVVTFSKPITSYGINMTYMSNSATNLYLVNYSPSSFTIRARTNTDIAAVSFLTGSHVLSILVTNYG